MMLEDMLNGVALLETAGGSKTIKGPKGEESYNFFNIKDFSGKGFRAFDKVEKSRDAYRVYKSPEEAKQDMVSLLARKYPKAIEAAEKGDVLGFAKALKAGGYATDPMYVTKLTGAIKTASTPAGSLKILANQGWDADIAYARQKGFTDAQIAEKIKAASSGTVRVPSKDEVQAERAARQEVAKLAATGQNANRQIDVLRQAGWDADIDYALEKGFKPEEIVRRIAGEEVAAGQTAKKKADGKNFVQKYWSGIGDAVDDVVLGTKQIVADVTGDKKRTEQLRQEQRNRQNDLNRIAAGESTMHNVGNFVAKAAPSAAGIALAIPTGGASTGLTAIALGAAGGALGGAVQPTTDDGQRGTNALVGGALGAAGPAAGMTGRLVGRGVTVGTDKALKYGVPQQLVDERIDRYAAQGITNPNMAEIYPNAARARNFSEDRLVGSTWFGADKSAERTAAQQAFINRELGVKRKNISQTEQLLTKGPQFYGALQTGGGSLIPPAAIGQFLTRRVTDPSRVVRSVPDLPPALPPAPIPPGVPGIPPGTPDLDVDQIIQDYLRERALRNGASGGGV